jgi:hypothetical protein
MTKTTVKRLICCRFQCTGKVMGQVYRYWWKRFSRFKYHMLYVSYSFVTYVMILLHTNCYIIKCLHGICKYGGLKRVEKKFDVAYFKAVT